MRSRAWATPSRRRWSPRSLPSSPGAEPFVALGIGSFAWVFIWFWYFRDVPAEHRGITEADMARLPNHGQGVNRQRVQVPWQRLIRRMAPVTAVYFCYGWTLWLYLNWLPQYFIHEYNLQLARSALFSATVFFAGVGGDYLGGVISDRILHATGDLRKARRDFVIVAFVCSFVFMLPVFATHNLTIIVFSLAAAFFCAELVIGPMWSIPMDIAPKYSGTASGLMNTGSAIAAVLSPLAFGYIVEWTDNWQLPFIGSLGLLLTGAALAFTMHPERADNPAAFATRTVSRCTRAPSGRLGRTTATEAALRRRHEPEPLRDLARVQKSSCTLIFAKRAVTIVVGTRQPVAVAFEYVEFSASTVLTLNAL